VVPVFDLTELTGMTISSTIVFLAPGEVLAALFHFNSVVSSVRGARRVNDVDVGFPLLLFGQVCSGPTLRQDCPGGWNETTLVNSQLVCWPSIETM
jgi:hypothetical protein